MRKKGFTLIEMMLVLFIISILVLLVLPNIREQQDVANDKGCQAYMKMVEAQAGTYKLQTGMDATIDELVNLKYIVSKTCPEGKEITIISGKPTHVTP